MLHRNNRMKIIMIALLLQIIPTPLVLRAFAADGKPPTVSILNPGPGTATTPAAVSLRAGSNDFKVQIQVWDDAPITPGSVQVGYYTGASPDTGTFTFVAASLNTNYRCGTNCGVYDALIAGLTPGSSYYLYARAASADGSGESRQNRIGNDARYVALRIAAPKTGTGTLLGRDSSSQLCLDCHNLPLHSSQTTSTKYQNWQIVCLECHTPHDTRNLYVVRESIKTPRSGTKSVTFYNTTGDALNSYGNAAVGASTTGICQVCHTQTRNPISLAARWTNAGNSDPGHYQAPGSQRCTLCHGHRSGFSVGCNCHAVPQGLRRQVLGAGGDFNRESHHVVDYGNRNGEIVTPEDCVVCHDMASHQGGTIRLKNKDNAGQVIVYQPSNPKSLEPFCLSCHDTNGALTEVSPLRPFSDGNTLGMGWNIAGDKIAGYWASSSTAHKTSGLTCAGTGALNTGCHGNGNTINMHGSGNRGLLARNMTNPIPGTQAAYNYNDYKLCFDCHANLSNVSKEVVLGYKQNGHYDVAYSSPTFTLPVTPYYTPTTQTLFRDRYLAGDPRPYNDIMFLFDYAYMPLHNLHLLGSVSDPLVPSIPNWMTANYRGEASQAGRITCTSCHNVHGTNAAVRSTYDELILTPGTSGADGFTTLPYPAARQEVMQSYPMNCATDCHGINGPSSYWNAPEPEWNPTAPTCNCHMAPTATRRQVLGAGGDFDAEAHHVINYGSRRSEIIMPADCLVCHDMATHKGGSIRLRNKDNAGQIIVYQPSTPSSLEPFCLSCHDANGASTEATPLKPFSDGNTLGMGWNIAGNKIASYWTASTTVHKTGGLTCAGTGAPNTGCHGNSGVINMHGSPSRGMLARNMTAPIPVSQATFSYRDYQLCFDCHGSYPAVTKERVLGYRAGGAYDVVYSSSTFTLQRTPYLTTGILTQFRDQFISADTRTYNDIMPLFSYSKMPLHNLHLLGSYYDPLIPSHENWLSWSYRGEVSETGRITCVSCHNVHGTNTSVGSAYSELLLTRGVSGPDGYTKLPYPAATQDVMMSYPMSCAVDCHGINGPATYWHTPANE